MTFLENQKRSFPQPDDSFPVAGEAMHDFWSMSGSFIYRHHVEPRVELYSPKEESFPIPLIYVTIEKKTTPGLLIQIWMSSKRSASMIIGILMALETCLILGQVSHNLLYSIYMVRGEINKKSSLHPGQIIYGPESMEVNGKEH